MSRSAQIYTLVLLTLAGALGISLALAPAPVSSLPSVHNPGPRGLMALRLLLEQVPGFEVRVHSQPDWPAEGLQGELLVVAEPAVRAYSEAEAMALLARAEAGARLVLLLSGSEGEQAVGLRALLRELGLNSHDVMPCEARSVGYEPLLAGVERPLTGVAHLLIAEPAQAHSLLSCPSGSALLSLPHGCGEVLVLSQLELLDNRHLGQPERARLALNLLAPAGAESVLFDESHHTRERPAIGLASLLRRPPFLGAATVLGLACLLFVWGRAPRRGGVRPAPKLVGVEVEPSVRGLALLYRESRDHAALWQRVLDCAREAGLSPEDPSPPRDLDTFAHRAGALLAQVDAHRGAGRVGRGRR